MVARDINRRFKVCPLVGNNRPVKISGADRQAGSREVSEHRLDERSAALRRQRRSRRPQR
jgi:hypothetical protein